MTISFFQLPGNILSLIYQYDGTYRTILSEMMDMIIWDKMTKQYIASLMETPNYYSHLPTAEFTAYLKDALYFLILQIRKNRSITIIRDHFHIRNLYVSCERKSFYVHDKKKTFKESKGFQIEIALIDPDAMYEIKRSTFTVKEIDVPTFEYANGHNLVLNRT
jgi:asparagine synthetase B (glutamine-hydrolysing)